MTSRRQFLKIGLGAAAATPVGDVSVAATPFDAATLPLYKAIYDVRFPSSIAFARRAAGHGIATHATLGDITSFWYHDLYHRWAEVPVAIAGLTGYGALFCLERLAWDQRLRVVFRAEHVPAGGAVSHGFAGPEELTAEACAAVARGEWAEGMADIVASCPGGRGVGRDADVRATSLSPMAESETLYSWVIGPAVRG
jgi:hypothetical protein